VGPAQERHGSVRPGDLDDLAGEQTANAWHDRDLALAQTGPKAPFEKAGRRIWFLRSWLMANSTTGWLAWIRTPWPLDACGTPSPVSRNSFAGTQPRCRQVPPTCPFPPRPHRQSRGPRVQSRGIPPGPPTDDDYVELRRFSLVRWQTDPPPRFNDDSSARSATCRRRASLPRGWRSGSAKAFRSIEWAEPRTDTRTPSPFWSSARTQPVGRPAACPQRPSRWSARRPARSCRSPGCRGNSS